MTSSPQAGELLVRQGVATLHEASGRHGLLTGLNLVVGPSFAGRALTVNIPAGDNLGIHLALERLEPGWVLCVASGGHGLYGVVGELLVEAARVRGAAGLVIDDGIRDKAQLSPLPSIAARGIASHGTIKRRLISLCEPVTIGGSWIDYGDWIVADGDGVCVIPAFRLDEIQESAVTRTAKEDVMREKIRAGHSTVEFFAGGMPPPAAAEREGAGARSG